MENGAITLLDILGWKGIWQRNGNAIDSLLKIVNSTKKITEQAYKKEKIGKKGSANVFKGINTEVTSISDTIAIVSYGEPNVTIEYHSLLSSFVIAKSIIEGLPVRGAISFGQVQTNGNIFAGPAVDEVSTWYESAQWVGVILTPSAQYNKTKNVLDWGKPILVEYELFIKEIGKYSTLCVNWTPIWKKEYKNGLQELKNSFLRLGVISPDIALKLSNTVKFYNTMNNK